MSFLKVSVKQQNDGQPGFIEEEEFEIQVNTDQITLFNRSDDSKDITFIRLSCGATLCVSMSYPKFVVALQKALKSEAWKIEK